ncbi:MAG TPA: hypothetical protein VM389_00040 [Phycisphaerae bacterium]|nr:hypothetical protein [Phycisphaerae bacterium]
MKRIAAVMIAGLLLVATGPVRAGISNPGFETGDLTGWTRDNGGGNGDVQVVTSAAGGKWTAIEGTYFATLQTDDSGRDVWTALAQQITLEAGDRVRFQYFFRGRGPATQAEAFVELIAPPDINIITLRGNSFNTPEGVWQEASSTGVTYTGTYGLRIRINDPGSGSRSLMGVDDFQVLKSGSMPEPVTMIAAFMGLAGIAGYVRRRRTP